MIRAASALGIAQPALSRSLHALEHLVGAALMDRGARGVRLTAAGEELLRALEPLFDRVAETLRLVRLTGEGKAGTLRLGLTRAALDSRRIGRALAALQDSLPDLTLIVSEVDTGQQSDQLRTGAPDLGIGFAGFADEGLRSLPLCDVQVDSALVAESHPLASARPIQLRQLSGLTLLFVGPQHAPFNQDLLERLRAHGVRDYDVQPTLASVFSLVAAGRGWSIAPGELSAPLGTVVVPLRGLDITLTLAARSRPGDPSPLADNVSRFLCRAINDEHGVAPSNAHRLEHPHSAGLNLRQMRSFVTTAEAGSISLASRRLGMTQSGLSRQLRSFEGDLGVVLFRRRLAGVELTPAGDLLRAEVPRIEALVDSALARVATTAGGVTGRCTIGAMAAEFTGNLIRDVIRHVANRHPAVSIQIDEMLSLAQVAALTARRIDLGLAAATTPLRDDQQLDALPVLDDPLDCALVSASSSLARRKWIRPGDLADLPFRFIERDTNPAFYDMVMERLGALGASPRPVGSYNATRAMWRAVTDVGGWTLGARSMRAAPFGRMVAIPIRGLHIPWGVRLLWRRDESDPAVLAVRNAFRDLVTGPTASKRRAARGQDAGARHGGHGHRR